MSFRLLIALLAVAGGPALADDTETRTITVTVTDEKGSPVQGLALEDVALLENGVARELTRFALDQRPLTVAFLLDTSEAMRTALRLHVIEPVVSFLTGLPSDSRYALWTVGERPTKRVDFTDDAKAARTSLNRIVPDGGSTLLDALLEATKDLRSKEAERNAVVVVSAVGPEFSSAYRERVVTETLSPDTTFHGVLLEEGATDIENRSNYDYVLGQLAKKSGGVYETTLSPMGLSKELQRVLGALKGQYLLTYATVPGLKERKLELTVARPGAKVRLPQVPDKKP